MKDYKKWTAAERNRSLAMTRKAKLLGFIPKPECCRFCGQKNGILHHHNTDYDVSLSVLPRILNGTATDEEKNALDKVLVPVCWTCHMMIHRADKHPKSAEAYFENVNNGMVPPASYSQNNWKSLEKYMID